MKKVDILFVIVAIIVGRVSYLFGHFPDFIWVFLATFFGFYTSFRLMKYSEDIEKRKELNNLLIAKQNILQYLKEEIEYNIGFMKNFTLKFKKELKANLKTTKMGWENVNTSFRTTGIWDRFVSYFDDFEFIKIIDKEYNKYIAIHRNMEIYLDKAYEMMEKYAINSKTYTTETKKIKTRYAIINVLIHRCIGEDNSSERCFGAIKGKIKEIQNRNIRQ